MLPYFLLLFIAGVFPIIIYGNRKLIYIYEYNSIINKRNKMTIRLFFIGLFILLALRDITVGKDLINYKAIYEICCFTPFEALSNLRWETGYTVYNKVLSLILDDYRFFLIITAGVSLFPIYKLYVREKRYSFLLIVLFINMPCFLMLFSGLRQSIAISIGILAFMALENKKRLLSCILILIAIYFHISAFVLILLYPMYFLKIKAKDLLYITPIMFAIYILKVPILTALFNILPSQYTEFYGVVKQTGAFGMMVLFLLFSIFSFVVLDESIMVRKDYFMRNVLLISTIFQFFVPIHGLIQRASYYFLIFVPVAILSIVQSPKKGLKDVSDLAIIVMGLFFFCYFFYNAMFSTDNLLDVFPYRFFGSEYIW